MKTGVENNEDGHVLGETKVVGNVLGEIEADGPLYEDTNFVGPVLEERDDENNIGSEKVGRFVNAYSNDITTDIAKNDEDDYSESEDFSAEGWLSDEDDEEIRELCVKKGKKLFFDGKGEVPRIELDPNGTFDLFVQKPTSFANPIFRRLYVCFGGLKEGFKKHCRPILSSDGCYLKGDFKGDLLAAVGRDGNSQILLVAWVAVEVENRETWAWFLEHIQTDLETGDRDRFTIFSYLQKSKQTHESTSSQPTAIDVSQPHGPNPSQPATTDVSQPPAPSSSQPATSQVSQPRFPKSENTSTRTKTKASC
ncbi:hypothetical protein V6N11_028986 [Hibiscus sabdariffa]|uniref:MULE transposase domain-containing protein n=1 Tax=Hibiscus sabdariffa TaxID=183260 RepID=A0ABR2NW47_9ROSI